MENELDDFINYDDKFVDQPQFHSELLNLSCTTSDSEDNALSVSEKYLRNVSDVDYIFQNSTMICLGLAKEIMTFVNDTRKGSPN